MINRLGGDYFFNSVRANAIYLPGNSVGDEEVDPTRPITVNKLNHQHAVVYAQDRGAVVAAKRAGFHVAIGDGTLAALEACLTLANSGGTVTVDLYKNGVSVLSGVLSITTETAFTLVPGSISTADYAAGDVFEVVVAVSGSTLGQGLVVRAVFEEEAG